MSEMTIEEFMDGRGEDARAVRRTRFKLAEKRGALVSLAELLGFVKQKIELDASVKVDRKEAVNEAKLLTDEEVAILAKIDANVQERRGGRA